MPRSTRHRNRALRRACCALLVIDRLEPRRLLASVGITSGVLTVNADGTNDTINIAPAVNGNVNVTLNGSTSTFAAASFTSIVVNGNGGNDKVALSNNLAKPSTIRGGAGNDSLVGGGGADVIDGGAGGDTIKGQGGNDTVDYSARTAAVTVGLGTLSDDGEANEKDNVATDIETILGGSAGDSLKGAGNNNRIEGRGGNDTLIGLAGNDTLVGGTGSDRLEGGDGADTGIDTAGDTTFGVENVTGAAGTARITADRSLVVTGTPNADTISTSRSGSTTTVVLNGKQFTFAAANFDRVRINALDGNDLVQVLNQHGFSQFADFVVDAGAGNDRMELHDAIGHLIGGSGNDSVFCQESNATFDGGGGTDEYEEHVTGGNTIDLNYMPTVENAKAFAGHVFGNALSNRLTVVTGGWSISGRGGNDTIVALGQDGLGMTLRGGAGNDSITGSSGPDTIDGGAGADVMGGGGGNDTLDYSTRTGALTVQPGDGIANDGELNEKDNVGGDIETIIGGSGADKIRGTAAANYLVGNAGNDTLEGLGGNDTFVGGSGADRLDGGADSDAAANDGADTLVSIENPGGAPTATITAARTLVIRGTGGGDHLIVMGNSDGTGGEDSGTWERLDVHLKGAAGPVVSFNTNDFDRILIEGLGGNDVLRYDEQQMPHHPVTMSGGDGNDDVTLLGIDVTATVSGGTGNDRVISNGRLPSFDGGAGTDTIEMEFLPDAGLDLRNYPTVENAQSGEGTLYGNNLNNLLVLRRSGQISGLGGNDTLRALGEETEDGSVLDGGDGNDQLFGSPFADYFFGEAGDDTLNGGSGDDSMQGGTGADQLNGNNGNDWLHGMEGNDRLFGGNGNDELFGDEGDDLLYGQNNADTLDGGVGGNDRGFDDGQDTLTEIEVILS